MRFAFGLTTRGAAGVAAILLLQAPFAQGKKSVKAPVLPPRPPLPDATALSAKSAILIDEQSGKVLWSKDADTSRFPASTTKIMTALLMIERCRPNDIVTAPKDIEKVGEASLHLKSGEKMTVRDLLWGMLLRSGNDGCVAAAVHCSGSVEAFCKEMNDRAKQIGCTNTNFHNPNGLPDKEHSTTAHDLALIAREAMRYPEFREIVHNRKHTIERSINTADTLMVSKNKFIEADPTADGIKTGYTRAAGQCFVGSATRGGNRLISVVLASESWLPDTMSLVNWGFANFEVRRTLLAGQPLEDKLKLAGGAEIAAGPVRAVRFMARKGSDGAVTMEPKWSSGLQAPIVRGQQVGMLSISDGTGWTDEIPLVALESVQSSKVAGSVSKGPFAFVGIGFVGLWAWNRHKRRQVYGRRIAF